MNKNLEALGLKPGDIFTCNTLSVLRESLGEYPKNEKIKNHYCDGTLAFVLGALIPGFEYPDWDYKTIRDAIKEIDRRMATPMPRIAQTAFQEIEIGLSPENLLKDGSASRADTARRITALHEAWRELEQKLGYRVGIDDPILGGAAKDRFQNRSAESASMSKESIDTETQQVLQRLHDDLTNIGFGSDDSISGADLVDLMQEHYERIDGLLGKLQKNRMAPVRPRVKP